MMRTVGGVLAGYVAMALIVFACLTAAYLGMGAERAFRPGVYDVSMLWAVVSIVIGFLAAWVGGWVARKIARSRRGPQALAAVVVVLGLALAIPTLGGGLPEAPPRTGAPANMAAMQQARTPAWLALLNPVIGALGVLVGGRALGAAGEDFDVPRAA